MLIGATAGIDDPDERLARRVADERLADHIEVIGVDAFIDEWLAMPLFAGLSRADSDARRPAPEHRRRPWRQACGHGHGNPGAAVGALGELDVPVLVLAGEHDTKFRAIGERMAGLLSAPTFEVIAGAGHSVHLEQPDATAAAIADWHRLQTG